ncbi:hypothetical protein TNCV_503601, partial [Trichonephila clavipes]
MNMAIRPVKKCPKFPQPKKDSPIFLNKTFNSNVLKQGVSFANVVSGVTSPPFPPLENKNAKTNGNINSVKEIHEIGLNENTPDSEPKFSFQKLLSSFHLMLTPNIHLVDSVFQSARATPLFLSSETPPTTIHQVASQSQFQNQIEDGGIRPDP